jgi:hypothetical protein
VASAETLPAHSDTIPICSFLSHVVHITFQGVSQEAFSRKVVLRHYYEIATWLSPANSRKLPKKVVLQVYTVTISHLIRK